MWTKIKASILTAAFILCVAVTLPEVAHAQAATPPDCSPGGAIQTGLATNLAAAAQRKTAAVHNFYTGIPVLDLKANYCITQIEGLFNLAVGAGDPTHILGVIFTNLLTQIANQVCSAALQTVTSVVNFGLSQFNRLCVPLPNLNLNISGGLNLKGPTCNGVNILGIKTTTGGGALPPGMWQIWNNQ